MDILEWFDIDNTNHLKAYLHLEETGMWPEDFVPDDITFSTSWHIVIMSKMADAYVRIQLDMI